MLLEAGQMKGILGELLTQTRCGRLVWGLEDGELSAVLSKRMTVILSRTPEGLLTASVRRGPDVLGRIELRGPGEAELYEGALASARQDAYTELMDAIKASGSFAPHPLPPRVTADVRDRVFGMLKGRWAVEYSTGKEVARIDAGGSYFVEGRGEKPAFHLVVIATNPDLTKVEVAKDFPDGRRKQIEFLNLGKDAMSGYAKHDGRSITYKRA